MLFKEDASYYADQVKNAEVTPLELTQAAIQNIKQLNPILNAVSDFQEEYALEKAKEMTDYIANLDARSRKNLPTFYGVPTLLKDLGQNLKGFANTSGSKLLKDAVADKTDFYTERLLEAGFIFLGKTNVPEFGFKGISDSKTTGPVDHPFKIGYNPGGSSGGAAAAVKSGMVPIACASDGGGSIRMPASFSGLIGLKPSRGRIIIGPDRYRGWQGAAVSFMLTKSVRDTWAMLKVLQEEQYTAPFMVPKIDQDQLDSVDGQLKIAYSLNGMLDTDLSDQARSAIITAKENLETLGHQLVEDSPDVNEVEIIDAYYTMNMVETAAMMDGIMKSIGREIRFDDMEPLSWLMTRAGNKVLGKDYSKILNQWDQFGAQFERFFEDYDVLVFPVANGPAPKQGQFEPSDDLVERIKQVDELSPSDHRDLVWEYFADLREYMGFSVPVNLSGQPSISLPMYETEDGWPIGVQLWAKKGNDYLLLQVAKDLEAKGFIKSNIVSVNDQ